MRFYPNSYTFAHSKKSLIMSNRREYEIAFVGLKPGEHIYEYQITDSFFEEFQEQDFKNANATVMLKLEKSLSSFMILRFEIGGTAEVICDRCSNNLPFQLFDEFTVTVKMVEDPEAANEQEEDPDVFYISKGESHIDVKDWLYEFINLSLPMQKTCDFENMDGPYCNPAARDLLNNMRPTEAEKENPIWKDLKGKFKDLE
jgi:uncharacterized metal-binding protein YceD (DUF177 family)